MNVHTSACIADNPLGLGCGEQEGHRQHHHRSLPDPRRFSYSLGEVGMGEGILSVLVNIYGWNSLVVRYTLS